MILGVEIALLIFGLIAIVTGKLKVGKDKVVVGTPARLLGIIGLLPIPVALAIDIALIVAMGLTQPEQIHRQQGFFTVIELGCLVGCAVLLYAIGYSVLRKHEAKRLLDDEYDDALDDDDLEDGIPQRQRRPSGISSDAISDRPLRDASSREIRMKRSDSGPV